MSVDYIAYDSAKNRVWVPVGNAGSVFVLDVAAGSFARVEGFKTVEKEVRGQKRIMGPSAVAIGDGVAYIGNRATNEVCVVDGTSLALGACTKLASPTDGVAYVSSAKEVWVTTPRDHSLTILDAKKPGALKVKATVKTDGDPEGYAVDDPHGVFYTNLEDKDRTLAIDVKKHTVSASVATGCGGDGPRGIAVDGQRGLVMVACTDGLRVLDAAHGLAALGKLDTGAGTDNIDYDPMTKNLVVGSGKVAHVTVVHVDDKGQLSVVGTADTADGARNAVADSTGIVYVVDAKNGKLVIAHTKPAPTQ